MTSGTPVDAEFVRALRRLDRKHELPYAELWRQLIPVAAGLGSPRPSYGSVRTIVRLLRAFERQRKPVRDEVVARLLTGRLPADQLIDLVQMNTSPTWWEWLAEQEGRSGRAAAGSGGSAGRAAERSAK